MKELELLRAAFMPVLLSAIGLIHQAECFPELLDMRMSRLSKFFPQLCPQFAQEFDHIAMIGMCCEFGLNKDYSNPCTISVGVKGTGGCAVWLVAGEFNVAGPVH